MTITITRTQPNASCRRVGLSLAKQSGRVLIRRIQADSLFANTAIQPDQEVVSVNGNPVKKLPVQQVVELLQQHPTVTLVAKTEEDYDDIETCSMGQFLINPCWFLYVKMQRLRGAKKNKQHDSRVHKMLWMSRLQISLYLICFYTVWWIVFTKALPLNKMQHHLSQGHVWFVHILFVAAVASWIAATLVSPGSITQDSMARYDNYRYDGILYPKDNNICPTLHIRKLARSKYDRYSQKHVPRFDHFCTWLGQTIGEENYRFFLVFLAIHAVMVIYGYWCFSYILLGELNLHEEMTLLQAVTTYPSLTFGMMFNILACIPTVGFLFFHMSLIRQGMTTNEFYKWKDLRTKKSPDIERAGDSSCKSSTSGHHRNMYNLGWLHNWHEVFFPRSLRRSTDRMRYKEL